MVLPSCRFTLLGVGAMNSPRYAPAGLLVEHRGSRVAIDGGPPAEPKGGLDAWLVTDRHAELIGPLRRLARAHGVEPTIDAFRGPGISITPLSVVHTSHPTVGYLVVVGGKRVGWAPEFFEFPAWASGVDLLFAEAAAWNRPIRFAHGTGGHAPVVEVARQALAHQVKRLVFAHIGRPTIAAIDAGLVPPFGEMGVDGNVYLLDSL
ncbi:MAG TPA: MBL fold metallo-hydrolase [Acidimicrobiales bacterium]|nr:MBL fold metallo-hydrolase [Acidimicrobiales bacterium]